MKRAISLTILLGLMASPLGRASEPPVIHFSIFAPPLQPPTPTDASDRKAPVHIAGFQNDRTAVRFLVSNDSDKPVVGVAISYFEVVPEGCGNEAWPKPGANGNRAGAFLVRIAPHDRALTNGIGNPLGHSVTGPNPHDAKLTFQAAQRLHAAYVQVQVGVSGVWFEDGSTWPAHWQGENPPGHSGPFNTTLIEAEAGKCPDTARTLNALQPIKEVVFGPEAPPTSDFDDSDTTIPHLRFSCSLDGSRAVCRLPFNPPDGISTKSHQNDK
jgi:hypothetical protein